MKLLFLVVSGDGKKSVNISADLFYSVIIP